MSEQNSVITENIIKRAYIALSDKQWDEAFKLSEDVLNNDPEEAEGYLIKLMWSLKVTGVDALKEKNVDFTNNLNYRNFLRFAKDERKTEIQSILTEIRRNIIEQIYQRGVQLLESANAPSKENKQKLLQAQRYFEQIPDYKDSNELKVTVKNKLYEFECSKKGKISRIFKIVFISLAVVVIIAGIILIYNFAAISEYNKNVDKISSGKYYEAYYYFAENDIKDSSTKRIECIEKWAESMLDDASDLSQAAKMNITDILEDDNEAADAYFSVVEKDLKKKISKEDFPEYTYNHGNVVRYLPDSYYNKKIYMIDVIHVIYLYNDHKYYEAVDAYNALEKYTIKHFESRMVYDWADHVLSAEHYCGYPYTINDNEISDMIYERVYADFLKNYSVDKDCYYYTALLEALPFEYPETKEMLAILGEDVDYESCDFSTLWQYENIRPALFTNGKIKYFMLGKWSSGSEYIRFYINENGGISISYTLPVPEVAHSYYDVKEQTVVFLNENSEWVADVFKITFTGVDSMNLYCFVNDKTYFLTR
ncbi:MAG: hypothetical protein E7591_04255 [Ruminococcaceae bacterium]|nr:hypothetical protein [Oscillospiraceae bacterium]